MSPLCHPLPIDFPYPNVLDAIGLFESTRRRRPDSWVNIRYIATAKSLDFAIDVLIAATANSLEICAEDLKDDPRLRQASERALSQFRHPEFRRYLAGVLGMA